MTLKKIISLNTVEKKNRNNLCNSYAQQFKHMNPLKLSLTENKPLNKERLITLLTKHSPPVQLHNKDDNNTYSFKNTAHKTSIRNLKEKANNGDTSAMVDLATKYLNGDGDRIYQNKDKAIFWFKKLAKKEITYAQFKLGVMYENADGVPKNNLTAIKWYKKAANQGYKAAIIALNNLGNLYHESKNYEMAIECYQVGVDKGDADSQYYLGLLYTNGYDEVPPKVIKALNLFEKAASQGDFASQCIIKHTKNSKDVPEPEDTKHTSSNLDLKNINKRPKPPIELTPTSYFNENQFYFKLGLALGVLAVLLSSMLSSIIIKYPSATQKKT